MRTGLAKAGGIYLGERGLQLGLQLGDALLQLLVPGVLLRLATLGQLARHLGARLLLGQLSLGTGTRGCEMNFLWFVVVARRVRAQLGLETLGLASLLVELLLERQIGRLRRNERLGTGACRLVVRLGRLGRLVLTRRVRSQVCNERDGENTHGHRHNTT